MAWDPLRFLTDLSDDPLTALQHVVDCRRDGTLNVVEAIRLMIAKNQWVEVAVALGRDALEKNPTLVSTPLFALIQTAGDQIVAASLPADRGAVPTRLQLLIRKTTQGGQLTEPELAEARKLVLEFLDQSGPGKGA